MSKMIQIRDVPENVHRILKARAASDGMSLSDYLKRQLQHITERPTMKEWLESTRLSKPVRTARTSAEVIRALRDSR